MDKQDVQTSLVHYADRVRQCKHILETRRRLGCLKSERSDVQLRGKQLRGGFTRHAMLKSAAVMRLSPLEDLAASD